MSQVVKVKWATWERQDYQDFLEIQVYLDLLVWEVRHFKLILPVKYNFTLTKLQTFLFYYYHKVILVLVVQVEKVENLDLREKEESQVFKAPLEKWMT